MGTEITKSTADASIEFSELYPAISTDSDVRAAIEENLGGEIDESMLTVIRMPTAGGSMWEIPTPFGDSEILKTIECVIIGQLVRRGFWPTEYGKGASGAPPVCTATAVSQSRLVGIADTSALADNPDAAALAVKPGGPCSACPYGQFGSHPSGDNRQWCRSSRVLMVLRPGNILPTIVRLPGTSDHAFTSYAFQLANAGKKLSSVVTTIGIERKASAGGIDYSAATFSAGEMPEAAAEAMATYRQSSGFSSAEQVMRESAAVLED